MKKIILLTLMFGALISCDKKNIAKDAYKGLEKQQQENAELDSITKFARNSFDDFKLALEMKDATMSNFIVKQEYIVKEGDRTRQEHLWIRDVYLDNGVLKGVVDNKPVATKEVKLNDTVTIDDNKISDWMFYKVEGTDTIPKVIGGYSVKYMRSKLSDKEKIDFDKQYQAKFD